MAKRDERIDTLKGVLITLVVFGHCFKYGNPTDCVKMTASNWVYLFHMPFFVFLSGYFTHPKSKSFWKGVIAVAESYLVFQLFKGILAGYSVREILTVPTPMMWYLLALIVWRSLYFLIDRLPHSRDINIFIAVILFIIGIGVGFCGNIGRTFALSRIIVFAPFFWLGTLFQGKDFISPCKKLPKWVACLIFITTVALIAWLSPQEWLNVRETVRGAQGYETGHEIVGMLSRCVYYVLAVILSVSLTSVVTTSKLMNEIGRDSMKFYLFHSVILPFMVIMKLPWNWYLSIAYGLLVMCAIYFFNKTKLSDFALRPFHFVADRIRAKITINNG